MRELGAGDAGVQPHGAALHEASFNAATDGLAGIQQLAGDATLLYYTTDEAKEVATRSRRSALPTSPSSPSFRKIARLAGGNRKAGIRQR